MVGVAISFFGLNTRKALNPTSFTVLGVINKFLTLIVNRIVWTHHASGVGILCAGLTILGGVLYQYFMGKDSITKRQKKPEEEESPKHEPKQIDRKESPTTSMSRSASVK